MLQPEKLHGHSIVVKDKTGREIKGRLEVAMVNDKGQSVVRACYNLNPDSSYWIVPNALRAARHLGIDEKKIISAVI